MKVKVNERCIGCGACIALTDSKIFDYNDEGQAICITNEINDNDKEIVEEAITYCPVGAIEKIEK